METRILAMPALQFSELRLLAGAIAESAVSIAEPRSGKRG
jgi:hypothetical protein